MEKYVTLIGAEAVQRAGVEIRAAAETMSYSAASIAEALSRHERAMVEFVERLEALVPAPAPTPELWPPAPDGQPEPPVSVFLPVPPPPRSKD